jgi:hypothetical protein
VLILVGGALANKPGNGGAAWTRLSWILGFRKLGFDVLFVEQIASARCTDAWGRPAPVDRSANLEYFRTVTSEFGLSAAAALIVDEGRQIHGIDRRELLARAEAADLLINISGHLTWPAIRRRCRRQAFIDLDPGFTQIWQSSGSGGARLEGHDVYFTVGENVGTSSCSIPACGIDWRPIRQPVLLDEWPVSTDGDPCRFTTVASWRGAFGQVAHDGVSFGVKAHEFRRFTELPALAGRTFEIALDIHPADEPDRTRLVDRGWRVVDPRMLAHDPGAFRRYVQGSGAEWSAAQGVYVHTRSGWFSDRTVRYLASGKPVLVQDTGCRRYPIGEGLLTFSSVEEARDGAARIGRDYQAHCRAARAIAEEWFSSDRVLAELIDQTGVAA